MSETNGVAGTGGTEWSRGERRALQQLLRRLLRGAVAVADEEPETGADLLRRATACGLVREAGGLLSATAEARAFLRRLALPDDDAFAGQHRIEETVVVELQGSRQPARRNRLESPLSGLVRLKDRNGSAFLPVAAVDAGERLLSDFTRAQLQPKITVSWEPILSGRVRGAAGGGGEIADSALAARARFLRAVEAMGPELSGVAVDVCCFAKGLETVERERQWPVRSAKLLLRAALLALARHYAPPAKESRRSHHWGADGYRPPLP